MNATDPAGLDAFAAPLLAPSFAASIGESKVRFSIEEARHALSFVRAEELAGKRVLEVGAGLGVLACFLSARGADVTAMEPGETGFEENREAAARVRAALGAPCRLLQCGIESLRPGEYGPYDMIFSNNVLEHVADPGRALAAMKGVLAPGGMMVHNCPNYAVPYEPHYRIPLVPAAPRLTRFLVPGRIREDACWRSLNFVTHATVKRAAESLGCDVVFQKELMYKAFLRLESDPMFGERQRGLPGLAYAALKKLGLLGAVRRVPYQWSTPMVFVMRPRHA